MEPLARSRESPRSCCSWREYRCSPRMLQQSLWLRLLPNLRRDPPPLSTHKRTIALLPRSISHSFRIKDLPRWRQYPRARHQDEEILQHIPNLLTHRRAPSHPPQSPPLRHRHPRQNHLQRIRSPLPRKQSHNPRPPSLRQNRHRHLLRHPLPRASYDSCP